MNKIDYTDIEKISDIVLQLDINSYLKMTTTLGRYNNNMRKPFASGFIVNGRDNSNKVSIKREFDYYLSIEKNDDQSFYVQFRPNVMILVLQKFEQVLNDFIINDSIWTITKDGIPKIIMSRVTPIEILGLQPRGKILRIDPIIYTRNGISDKGLRFTISKSSSYIDMDIDRFMGLLYTFRTFDMYQAAISQINSMSIYQHPRFVQDLVKMNSDTATDNYRSQIESEGVSRGVVGRKPRQKSFFDLDKD